MVKALFESLQVNLESHRPVRALNQKPNSCTASQCGGDNAEVKSWHLSLAMSFYPKSHARQTMYYMRLLLYDIIVPSQFSPGFRASAQSDQRLCCSLPRQNDISSLYIRNIKILGGLCSWAGQFVSCLVGDFQRHIFSWRGSSVLLTIWTVLVLLCCQIRWSPPIQIMLQPLLFVWETLI